MKRSFILFFIFYRAIAEYQTTITDSKNFSSSSKVIITESEIKNSKALNLSNLLASQANINIINTPFQPNSLFIRGGDSGQVLILIDGIPILDPSTIQRSFNLNSININAIQKITVIKGSQSVWYGGQALAAVVKIDTIPSVGNNNGGKINPFYLKGALGSESLKDIVFHINNSSEGTKNLIFRTQYQEQNLNSPVDNSNFTYKKRKENQELIYADQDESLWYFKLNHNSDWSENVTGFSYADFRAADTYDFITTNERNQLNFYYSDSTTAAKPIFYSGFVYSRRVFNHDINELNDSAENQEYKSVLIPVRGELRILSNSNFRWDIGASFQKESMLYQSFDEELANTFNEMSGVFTKIEKDLDRGTVLAFGLRSESDLSFGNFKTYQIGINHLNSKMEYSTGYKLPSLYQLYANKGNLSLRPEGARSFSFSQDWKYLEVWQFSFTLFETHIENLIAARGNPLQYTNIGRTITKGVESFLYFKPTDQDTYKMTLVYQEPRDINSTNWLARRPLKSGSLSYVNQQGPTKWTVDFIFQGDRLDFKNSSETVTLASYEVVNTSYIYDIKHNSSIFFRGENLFQRKYEQSYGYFRKNIEFNAGIEYYF